ncbi:hypothetical protein A2709_01345 [candidate division WWE3 bacterium RIFCSPHIGHO2_01_FULL_43_9]|uniref:Uncharacterized protein n=1 Tax=candidate division WWE3 bacterium RIFCSPHIGHO2_01_FULL_43_9 TaxID=1802618 RepID=A0A1F4V2C0_UNCKA|nr:MAG: hypothetical protein A2709_01345 [candidate division WWE3 bacterium RIFCSPHIGHO2_01_FULL_43_9]
MDGSACLPIHNARTPGFVEIVGIEPTSAFYFTHIDLEHCENALYIKQKPEYINAYKVRWHLLCVKYAYIFA